MTKQSEPLLPCPFCGGSFVALQYSQNDRKSRVVCQNCQISTAYHNSSTNPAITRWNRRASLKPGLGKCYDCGSDPENPCLACRIDPVVGCKLPLAPQAMTERELVTAFEEAVRSHCRSYGSSYSVIDGYEAKAKEARDKLIAALTSQAPAEPTSKNIKGGSK